MNDEWKQFHDHANIIFSDLPISDFASMFFGLDVKMIYFFLVVYKSLVALRWASLCYKIFKNWVCCWMLCVVHCAGCLISSFFIRGISVSPSVFNVDGALCFTSSFTSSLISLYFVSFSSSHEWKVIHALTHTVSPLTPVANKKV